MSDFTANTQDSPGRMQPRLIMRNGKRIDGYTVLELMIAMTIGLILLSAVSGTFVWSSRNFRQDDSTARMQENARYAMDALANDLQMAGFMHDVVNTIGIDTSLVSGKLIEDCGPSGAEWALQPNNLIEAVGQSSAADVAALHECIETDDLHLMNSAGTGFTNVLSIKRVAPINGAPVSGQVYLQTTLEGSARMLIQDLPGNPNNPAFNTATSWEYQTNIYYISTDNAVNRPTLYRKTLQGLNLGGVNTLRMDTEGGGIAEGIEYFHLTWGVDEEFIDGDDATVPDGQPNYFVSAPTSAQAPGIVAAKIYILVRSPNHDTKYVDEKQYILGDLTLPTAGTFGDNYHRKVFTTTIKLRNQVIRNLANSLVRI